jgi:plasmid stability protein
MGARGDHAGAEAEYRDVLAAELRVLGPDHPSTLTTRHEIARMIAAQGDHAGAEAEYRDVLADKVRVLGPDHPSTKATASWLPGPKP